MEATIKIGILIRPSGKLVVVLAPDNDWGKAIAQKWAEKVAGQRGWRQNQAVFILDGLFAHIETRPNCWVLRLTQCGHPDNQIEVRTHDPGDPKVSIPGFWLPLTNGGGHWASLTTPAFRKQQEEIRNNPPLKTCPVCGKQVSDLFEVKRGGQTIKICPACLRAKFNEI
ncbi:hypothetical protein [Thermogutta sp.]|uniref:hypothetical protein n=1 Tax=Thermogutta sp. TaxID=1962930 RepID=UPI00321FD995